MNLSVLEFPKLNNVPMFNPHLEDAGFKFFLTNNGKLIGYGSLTKWEGHEHPTIGLWVDESFRNRRFGRKIMLRIFRQAKKIGHKSVRLSVTKINFAAVHLYQSLGFYTTEDNGQVMWMQKDL